jgi:hypothetical protein
MLHQVTPLAAENFRRLLFSLNYFADASHAADAGGGTMHGGLPVVANEPLIAEACEEEVLGDVLLISFVDLDLFSFDKASAS